MFGWDACKQLRRNINSPKSSKLRSKKQESGRKSRDFPLNCTLSSQTCPTTNYPSSFLYEDDNHSPTPPPSCPEYFRWIHKDLWPWRETGITQEMLATARKKAHFRLVIVDGRAYLETYAKSFQTRDIYTQWGILQMLRRYPGKLPDLDLMFGCGDFPLIHKHEFGPDKVVAPPPLFQYCGNDTSLNIVFPDWTFWGWPEINTKPWDELRKELEKGNERKEWKEREPYAYWKGNLIVAEARQELLKCHVSEKQDWKARIYAHNWYAERKTGFKHSDLSGQCTHRYKIYIEGCAWSVSLKYIMACNSMTLFIMPNYYDFFSRGLVPLKHYWPLKATDKCRSIKHAVDWGNSHQEQAEAIGRAGSNYILNQVTTDYVYDYMFHLLNQYSKLLKFKPSVPRNAVEVCSESIACPAQGLIKKHMTDTRVKGPSTQEPCSMPPPHDPASYHSAIQTKEDRIKLVDTWENEYWQSGNKQVQ